MGWNDLYCEKWHAHKRELNWFCCTFNITVLNIGFNLFVLSHCRVASRQSGTSHPSGWGCYHKDRGWLEKTQHVVSLPGKILGVDYSLLGKLTPVMGCSVCRFVIQSEVQDMNASAFSFLSIVSTIPFLVRKIIKEALVLAVFYSNRLPSQRI